MAVTSWAITAMRRKSFAAYPRNIGAAEKAFKFRPKFRSITPKNGAKFKSHVVSIRATYTDFYPKGTGIKPSSSRLYVDNDNKSRPAVIGKYGLHLLLKNVPNGDHTYKIELRDNAGNVKSVERKFTVAVPSPTPTFSPTPRPTYTPGPVYPTVYPTTHAQAVHHADPGGDSDALRDVHAVPLRQPYADGEPRGHRLAGAVAKRLGQPGRHRSRGRRW